MSRAHSSRAAAAVILLLAGCAVGPNFKRPAPPAVSGYTQEPQPTQTASANIPGGEAQRFVRGLDIPGQWWTLFHSTALNSIIEGALKANPSLEAAQATLSEAEAQLHAGEGALLPTVSGSASTARERISGASFGIPGTLPIFTLNNASVSVSYLLDIWGGTRRQIEALGAEADYERFELEATYLSLSANVVTAAVEEASLRGQIAATREIITIEMQELDGLKREFAEGAAADTAVLAQAATLAQARAELPPLEKQLDQTRHQLSAYLGRFPSEALSETFTLNSLRLPEALPVSLPSKLVEQRPDILAAEAQLHSASAEIGVATSNMLPQLTLTGSYGSEAIGTLFSPGSTIWSIGAGVTQPLFEGGKLYYERKAAIAAFQAAAAQYRNTVLTAFQNVADALRALQSDADAVAAQSQAEQAAALSLAAARRQFHAGAISYLSLLTAEQTYEQTRINLITAEASRYSDTAALFQALGGGWWNRADVTAASD
jgi:NodT family efflux transporter outer membrane factor (OMF) lipoprotein